MGDRRKLGREAPLIYKKARGLQDSRGPIELYRYIPSVLQNCHQAVKVKSNGPDYSRRQAVCQSVLRKNPVKYAEQYSKGQVLQSLQKTR